MSWSNDISVKPMVSAQFGRKWKVHIPKYSLYLYTQNKNYPTKLPKLTLYLNP